MKFGNTRVLLIAFLLGGGFGSSTVWASPHHQPVVYQPVNYGECNGKERWRTFWPTYQTNYDTQCYISRDDKYDDKLYTTHEQWYENEKGDTCYVKKSRWKYDDCADGINGPALPPDVEGPHLPTEKELAALEGSSTRQSERATTKQDLGLFIVAAMSVQISSMNMLEYEASDLPEWDFDFSVQGSVKESEMALTPTLGRESDVKSLTFNFNAAKENFLLNSQLYYSGLKGTGTNDGMDTEVFGLFIKPGYTVFNHEENGFNLTLAGFIEMSGNDYGDNGSQTRLVPGVSIDASIVTPMGGFQVSDLFSHDRNLNGDMEITGDEYINFNTLTFAYFLPLSESLLFTTGLDYMLVMDMPDDMEDSSTGIFFDLSYYGWKDYSVGLNYVDSLDGYENRGVTLTVGHTW